MGKGSSFHGLGIGIVIFGPGLTAGGTLSGIASFGVVLLILGWRIVVNNC